MRKHILAVIFVLVAMVLFSACQDGDGGEGGGSGGNSPVENKPPSDLKESPVSDFEYRAIGGGIEITKYVGTSIRVRIPEKIEGVAVTVIGRYAFSESGIMEVYIPNSVTEIDQGAFSSNTGLTSVTIPNSVTSIGYSAFWRCTGLTSVTIGNSVKSIGERAFEDCTGLTSITIPDSVTEIGRGAFVGCENLTATYKGVTYSVAEEKTRREELDKAIKSEAERIRSEYFAANPGAGLDSEYVWEAVSEALGIGEDVIQRFRWGENSALDLLQEFYDAVNGR